MAEQTEKKKSCGALWRKVSQKDNKTRYFSGVWEQEDGTKVYFKAFVNSFKEEGSNQPDYRLYLDTPIQEQVEGTAPAKKTVPAKPAAKPVVKKAAPKPAPVEVEEEEQVDSSEEILLED